MRRAPLVLALVTALLLPALHGGPAGADAEPEASGNALRWTSKDFPGTSQGGMRWVASCFYNPQDNLGTWNWNVQMGERGSSNVRKMRLRIGLAAPTDLGGLTTFNIGGRPHAWVRGPTSWSTDLYLPYPNQQDYWTGQYVNSLTRTLNWAAFPGIRVVVEYHWRRDLLRRDTKVHQAVANCTSYFD